MTDNRFWELIEKAKGESDGDLDEMVELLRSYLVRLAPEEIVSFDSIYDDYRFKAYRRDLWGAAYLLDGGCSDDGFDYFRAWLIGQGRRVYEAALANPDSLADFADPSVEHQLEALMYAPDKAYREQTGQEMPAEVEGTRS